VSTPSLPAVRVTLRVAAGDTERDAAVEDWLRSTAPDSAPARPVVIAEGLLFDRLGPQRTPLVGLTAGCPCCTGQVALRVTLGRTLRRRRPDAVLLLTAHAGHLPRLRQLLRKVELGVRFEVEG
jgi:hypothetical protein